MQTYIVGMASSFPMHCLKCKDSFCVLKLPLSLPCGHALCKICTSKLELENNRKCPKCEEKWTEDLVGETAFFKMVTSTEVSSKTPTAEKEQQEDIEANLEEEKHRKKTEPHQVLCADHKEEVLFYCFTCEDVLCTECVTSKHKLHDFCTLKKGGQKVKAAISKALDEVRAKSMQETKLLDKHIAKVGQNKDLLQNFESEVTHEKNLQKNIQKKLILQHAAFSSKFLLFDEVTNLLETVNQEVSSSLIEELQGKLKLITEELVGASEKENPILVIARAYMVS